MLLTAPEVFYRPHLGDHRLEKRLHHIGQTLMQHPNQTLPSAFRCPHQLKAMYRFMNNKRVHYPHLLHSLAEGTLERLKPHPRILVVQDSSELDYTTHSSLRGVGHLHTHTQGLMFHSALAVSPQGLPLGILQQHCWARGHEIGIKHQRKKRKVEDKESAKWLNTLQDIEQRLFQGGYEGEALIISDRESDVWEYLTQPRSAQTHVLIRQAHDRRLHQDTLHLKDFLQGCTVKGEHRFFLPRAQQRLGRDVTVQIKYEQVEFQRPANKTGQVGVGKGKYARKPKDAVVEDAALRCWVIHIQEVVPVASPSTSSVELTLEWFLCTTLPVNSLQDAVEMLEAYTFRWLIERFHYVLKSGCGIEDLEFEDADHLQRALAVFSGVAFAVLHMTYLARLEPDGPCGVSEKYQQVASLALNGSPPFPLTNRQFVRLVGRLGGFLGRKGDGEPGVKVLWRGWQVLEMMVAGFDLQPRRLGG